MPSTEHRNILDRISAIAAVPDNQDSYEDWIKGIFHLEFLEDNISDDEIVIFASANSIFVKTAVVNKQSLSSTEKQALLDWDGGLDIAAASYSIGGPNNDVTVEFQSGIWGSSFLPDARPLVFARNFEGWSGSGQSYFEVLQEYSHITEIHWRPEEHAYCRFNRLGDLEHVVSVTSAEPGQRPRSELATFKRHPLDQYLAASESALIRMFDFTMLDRKTFNGWNRGAEIVFPENQNLFYHQEYVAGHAGYVRGIQIVGPSRPKSELLASIVGRNNTSSYVEFISHDIRNNRIAGISTDPSATTNYIKADTNNLPHEISPAFFRSEVLLRYTADQEKYTFEYRRLHCRGAWEIRYDVNEADQVHVYIRDLRRLPLEEQLYWKSFNEPPKAGISERALEHDIKGEWTDITEPIEGVQAILRNWADDRVDWWRVTDENLISRDITPRTESRDDWARAFMHLSNRTVAGFQTKIIRSRLRDAKIEFEKTDQSLVLLEKLRASQQDPHIPSSLEGLREVQAIRSKVAAHLGGSDAERLWHNARQQHRSYTAHFNHVCQIVTEELKIIEDLFS